MSDSSVAGDLALGAAFAPAERAAWQALVARALGDRDFDATLVTRTYEGLDLQPLYDRADARVAGAATRNDAGLTRGTAGWEIRQSVDHPDPAAANQALLHELASGATAVTLVMDPAGEHAAGPGAAGIFLPDRTALATVLDGVYLQAARVALAPGPLFAGAAALMLDHLETAGVDLATARVHFGADPLAALARRGHLAMTLPEALSAMAEIAERSAATLPAARAVTVDTTVYHAAGADEVLDLAIALSTGVAYLRAMTDHGLSVAAALAEIEFSLAAGVDLFMTVAKLRAARRLWARVAEASGGAAAMALHVGTAERVISRRDPWVNMLRATIAGFAAGVAGADSVAVAPYDQGGGLPTDFGRRIARNAQVILQEESALGQVIDPAGGSWFIEDLTERLAQAAWHRFQEIEAAGGVAAMLADGRLQAAVAEVWAARERDLAHRRTQIIGVNMFPNLDEEAPAPPSMAWPEIVAPWHARRPAPAAVDGDLATRVAAARHGAAIGDLSGGAAADGEDAAPITAHRLGEGFEALRDASDAWAEAHGQRPRVFIAALGTPAAHGARVDFTRNYLAAGGIEAIDGQGAPDEIAAAFTASGLDLAIICGSDKLYEAEGAAMAAALGGADWLGLAGRAANADVLRAAGIETFIHAGDDCLATLRAIHAKLGIAGP
ncbi:MAG: methylmalonyl-CoA mutase family protein [Pseudomonadota bacterium]|nr:methylmalonyl-CoA mutase family protein [Pseudomonadota bacterium]